MFEKKRAGLPAAAALWLPGFLLLGAGVLQAQSLTITPSGYPTVGVGGTLQFTAVANGFTLSGMKWLVNSLQGGAASTGTITTGLTGGLYTAPSAVPGQNPQTIGVVATATNGSKYSASVYVTILAPPAVITSVSPNPLPSGTATVTVTGSGFTSNSLIWDGGVQYPTQFTSANTLSASVYTSPSAASATFTVVTSGSVSNAITVPVGSASAASYSLQVVNGAGSGSYHAGAVVNISANAAPAGQQFVSWSGAGVANASASSTTLSMPAANTTVTANYGPVPPATYTLTVVNGTGSGAYAAGAVVPIAANSPPAGQQFQSWTGASVANSTSASTTITMPAANTTVTASYAAVPTYTLTVVNGTGSGAYAAGAVVPIAANSPPAGQQFQSWTGATVANSTSANTTITMPAANTTVTANYAAAAGGFSISSVSPNPVPSGTVTVTVTGSGFSSNPLIWASGVQYPTSQSTSNTLTTSVYIAPGTQSVTFTVHNGGMVSNALVVPVVGAAATTYTLAVVNGTGGGSYAAGTVVPIAANAPPAGQSFTGWTGAAVANASAASTSITMPAANTTVTANFAANATYQLTVVNGTGSGTYTAGTVVAITANPAPAGMAFSSWSGAPVTSTTSATTTLNMPAANTTVSANYSAPVSGAYTVMYSGMGCTAGCGPTDPNQYSPGQAVTVDGNIGYLFNPGHSFVGWNTAADGSGASYGAGATLIMGNSNVTLYPQWNTQDWPVSVWGGARDAIVLKADGSVWTWGLNTFGQLGNGTTTDNPLPGQVLGAGGAGYLTGVTAVMGGEEHNLALKSDGTVWAWGMNLVNQLGNGNSTSSSTPLQVSGLSSVVSIGSRGYHSLAVKSDGTVWAWGEDRWGALGNGVADTNLDYQVPVQVQGLSNPLMVTGGYYFSVALMPDHTLMAWGSNVNGQLGDGTTTSRYTPVPVQGIDHVIWVSAGWDHVVAIKSDGTVWTWGSNNWGGIYPGAGMLGDGTTLDHSLPEQVPGLAGAIQASGGDSFTSVLLKDGTVWTFGSNGAGQLGTGSFNPAQSLVPVQVQGLSNIVSITGRDHHNQAIRSDGTVWSWGSGENGELGNGTTQNSANVVQATGFGGN